MNNIKCVCGEQYNDVHVTRCHTCGIDMKCNVCSDECEYKGVHCFGPQYSRDRFNNDKGDTMELQIFNVYGSLIFSHDCEDNDMKKTVEAAVKLRVSLARADLSSIDLSNINLSNTNLMYSNLSGTNLSDSDLFGCNLLGSNLSGSDLSGSNLGHVNLMFANLSDSNLSDSDLSFTYGINLLDVKYKGSKIKHIKQFSGFGIGEIVFIVTSKDIYVNCGFNRFKGLISEFKSRVHVNKEYLAIIKMMEELYGNN